VWRTTGGKHRYLLGEADTLVADSIPEFRAAALAAIGDSRPLTLEALEAQQARLEDRRTQYGELADAVDIWSAQGIADPSGLPLLEADRFLSIVGPRRND
jgi:malonate decarboxylase beta subunit